MDVAVASLSMREATDIANALLCACFLASHSVRLTDGEIPWDEY